MDFETLYNERVERCSHETAFNKEEAEALYHLSSQLYGGQNVVEIGVEFGRSTTVLGQMAYEKNFSFTAIDAWVGEYSLQAKKHVEDVLIKEWGLPINLWSMPSSKAADLYIRDISLIHIDGDHTYGAVYEDCSKWLPKVVHGGIACFDDYGHESLPDVYAAVNDYLKPAEWVKIGHYGNKLGVFRKL